jgi:hypothetical protein
VGELDGIGRRVAASTLALLGLIAATTPAPADGRRWSTYVNDRFGYSICYPADLMRPQREADNSDGRKFVADDGAELIVYGGYNALADPVRDALRETSERLAGAGGRVTYRLLKTDRFVVSGFGASGGVFYASLVERDGRFRTFELTYATAHASIYDKVAARVNACFSDL